VTLHNPAPIEIDCRQCVLCGLQIDLHRMVDDGDGPQFFCIEAAALAERLLVGKFENTNGRPFALGWNLGIDFALKHLTLADAADTPDAEDAPPIVPAEREPAPYRPAASTVAAFKFVVSLGNAEHLARWLRDHPRDAPFMFKLLEAQ
jgi:hypothetical protein